MPVHRICILITTFRRNDALQRIAGQCREMIRNYRGTNRYELCIADSDPNNPLATSLDARYCLNPGDGFDDNLYYFWKNNLDRYDFIFTISDDDIFATWLNPLYLLDAAAETGADAVMFNHRNYQLQSNGSVQLGPIYYSDVDLVFNQAKLLHNILTLLPRHIGMMCSTRFLRERLPQISLFQRTLHLYAAPIIFAALKATLLFSDYTLCLFHTVEKADGAWTTGEDVLDGLAEFLRVLKELLPADLYRIAETGFFHNYLGADCWLRKTIRTGPALRSEQELREMLSNTMRSPPGQENRAMQ